MHNAQKLRLAGEMPWQALGIDARLTIGGMVQPGPDLRERLRFIAEAGQ